jgi:hypothetical protein
MPPFFGHKTTFKGYGNRKESYSTGIRILISVPVPAVGLVAGRVPFGGEHLPERESNTSPAPSRMLSALPEVG